MKKIKYIVIASLFGAFFTGCDDYLDINTNPDTSTTIIPEQSLPIVVFYAAQENYDHAEYGNYLSQALTTGGKSQTGTYAYKSGWEFLTMNRHPQWRRHFYDIGINVRELIKASEKMESSNFALIARTVRLMSTQLTTDVFGDMPLTEAYTGTSPKYDTQESIYAWMLQEADALIADYDNPALTQNPKNVQITPKMDRIFAGDLAKWKQFTIGLKARILLRKLPNWDNTPATCQQIIKTVDAALNGWTEPIYKYDGGTAEANCPWSKAQPSIGGWESRKNELDKAIPSEYLYKTMFGGKERMGSTMMASADDPRMESYLTARVGPKESPVLLYRYLKNNIGMDVSYKESHYPDLYNVLTKNGNPYTKVDGYVSLMLTEELLFIKAEATYWSGNKVGAHQLTEEAVRKNMDRMRPVITGDPNGDEASKKLYDSQSTALRFFNK
ncbi:MAG: SusD/RagB family nutrient-binding outer membrane lipoprotein, partial [Bacteroides sp.]